MMNAWILEVQLHRVTGSIRICLDNPHLGAPLRPFPGSAALQGQRFLQRHRSLFPGGMGRMGRKSIKHFPGSPTETVWFSTTKATPIAFPISITFWSEHKSRDRNMLQKQDRSFKLPRFTAAHLTTWNERYAMVLLAVEQESYYALDTRAWCWKRFPPTDQPWIAQPWPAINLIKSPAERNFSNCFIANH